MKRLNLTLLALIVVIAVAPLLLPLGDAAKFKGSDSQAADAISAFAPEYQPWFESPWKPPSGEVESLLFALQAAIGAGLLGYYVGLRRGQQRRREDDFRAGD